LTINRLSIRLIKNFDQELDDIALAQEGYNLQEIGILKRARNVMKKEGQNPDDALSWVRSEMADDAGVDFEDFMTDFDWGDFPGKAQGGRIGYAVGKIVKGGRWFINALKKNLTDMEAGHPRFKVVPAKDQETLKAGYRIFIKELEAGEEIPIEALEAISKNPQYYKTKKATRSKDFDLAEVEELIDEKVFGHVRQELKDFETVGRKSNAVGGRVPLMYGGDPGFAFEYGGSWADWHDQHRSQMPVEQYIKTKLPKDRLPFREMQSGGLAYMLGEPTYSAGGNVGHAPWLKPTGQRPQPQPQPQGGAPGGGRPDPMKAPRGLPSLAPRTMDPQVMQQQRMQQMMGQMGQRQPRMGMEEGGFTQEDFNRYLRERKQRDKEYFKGDFLDDFERWKKHQKGRTQTVAEGGRIGFGLGSMSRRAFLKMMAAVAALPIVGKGITKVAPKAIPKVTETIVRGADGMPTYIDNLIEVVKAKGARDVIEGFKRSDYSTVHRYKGVEVIEEAGGTTRIKKSTEGVVTDSTTGKSREGISKEVEMEIKPVETQVEPESGISSYIDDLGERRITEGLKKHEIPREYTEGTIRPDMDGKMKDIIEEIDEIDHLELKKIADEIDHLDDDIYQHKWSEGKASGGVAQLLGE